MPKFKRKKIMTEPAPPMIKGKFIGNPRGFGFVVQDDPEAVDTFIPPSMTGGALHGDEVLCRLNEKKAKPVHENNGYRLPKSQASPIPPDTGHRQSGQVVEIIHRKPLIGTYFTMGREGFVRPIEGKIPYVFTVSPKTRNRFGLADGHRVIFVAHKPKPESVRRSSKITDNFPLTVGMIRSLSGYTGDGDAIGGARDDEIVSALPCSIVEVIGHIHDPGVDVLTLVYQSGIPYQFPEDVQNQAANLSEEISEEDLQGRLDLRDMHIITIDGEDTKDIDDAISLTQTPEGNYQLGVHIADVSHYVKPGTPVDDEALNRGTSVYLADRVIPMLPHRLSSGICSLFPGVDRLTLSCMMTVDEDGHVVAYDIAPSVINSKRRWTYREVQEILDATTPESENSTQLFSIMNRLREILSQKRNKRGALDFDLPEARIKVDETGRPISIEPYLRTHATGMIEEFMILANETIAAHCQNHNIPLIYRAHDAPTPQKQAMLAGIAKSMGFTLPVISSGPRAIQQLLSAAESSPVYHGLAMAALTSLPQAVYTPTSPKHFGLASDAYCHFTSPIRRYADLQVHRIIKKQFAAAIPQQTRKSTPHGQPESAACESDITVISAQCSRTEREAEALEREVTQLKKVQFMQGQVGEIFMGTISGITPWGIFVMLENTIEGLIPSQHLKHHGLTYDKDKNHYENKRGRTILTMGKSISIRLTRADEDERKLTFSLCV